MNWALIAHLTGRGHEVDILLTRPRLPRPLTRLPGNVGVSGPRLWRAGSWVMAAEPRAALAGLARAILPSRAIRDMRRASGGADAVLGAFPTAAQAAWCGERIAASRPDAILIDTIFRAPVLDHPGLAGIPSALIAHDVFHRRHAALRLAGYRVEPPVLTRQDEAELLGKANALVAIQEAEAELLRDLCPGLPVISAPMPAIPCPRPEPVERDKRRLVFVGSDSLPNLDGLNWFLAEIWPLLALHRSGITLDLVGDSGMVLGGLPEGVHRLGRQPDLAEPLHQAALAIAPLRVGSGLKIKLLDYARHGLWTVATPPSLEGFAPDPAAPFIRGEGAVDFAEAILAALDDPPGEAAALDYITRHYGPDTVFAPLCELLDA
ncbi:MAG TPA: glycosyltransferase family 4 protein [Acetobacteraceae bacterium]|nr:glycosyltransferase family 4 protein [Acetobacteraceae bacterium]